MQIGLSIQLQADKFLR